MSQIVFWKSTPLDQMNAEQWESVCDGCGKCCLHKLQDEDTDEMAFTCIACEYLDHEKCRCKVYDQRLKHVPDCLDLKPSDISEISEWLPQSCAYRLLHENKPLPEWHHLVSGDPDLIHQLGYSMKDKVICETQVDEDDWLDYRID